MLRRPLPLLAVTIADYLLWRWSAASGPQVVAVITGLALLPLVLATLALGVSALTRRATGRKARHQRTGHGGGLGESPQEEAAEKPERIAA